jgi:hypothetical protein
MATLLGSSKGPLLAYAMLRVELAATTRPHDLDSVRYYSPPVKPLPEGVAHEGLGHRVVPACPRVDFS